MDASSPPPTPITIAIIGDVHEQWGPDDNTALENLGIDLALFVGDFGNEAVEIVRHVAALQCPKAVIFGNHDAWYSASPWGRAKCPYDRHKEDRLQAQIDLLGETEVGYRRLDFPDLQLSVVGGRPFSWGGSEWKNAEFYRDRYGITTFAESTTQIVTQALASPHNTLLLLGHNGPLGLGDRAESPCGRDWIPIGGDHGDPDFAAAIAQLQAHGKTIPLVTFGHMHHLLRHRRDRLRTQALYAPTGTLYLNAARVPRIQETPQGTHHHFALVELLAGQVQRVCMAWVDPSGAIVAEEPLTPELLPCPSLT